MYTIEKKDFGVNLKRLRENVNLSQGGLAVELNKLCGTDYNRVNVSKWENGSLPNVLLLPALATIFSIPLSYFFSLENEKNNEKKEEISLDQKLESLKHGRDSDPKKEVEKLLSIIDDLTVRLNKSEDTCKKLKQDKENAIKFLTND